MKAALICAALACGLGGCGQTGALYLPDKDSEVVSKGPESSAAATPATSPATSPATNAVTDPAADAEAARKRDQPPAPK